MGVYIGTITASSPSLSTLLSLDALISRVSNLIRRHDIDDEITQWLNFAQREAADLIDFPELRVTVYTTLIANTYAYDLPADYSRADHVYYLDNTVVNSEGRNLIPAPREYYSGDTFDFEKRLDKYAPTSGMPEYYFIDRNGIYIYPAPDRAARLELTYYKIPEDMVSAHDTPEISSRFRHYLIWLAYYWGMAFLEKKDMDKVASWEVKFDRVIDRLRKLVRRRENTVETIIPPSNGMENASRSY